MIYFTKLIEILFISCNQFNCSATALTLHVSRTESEGESEAISGQKYCF
jgi:hypothetical protein